MTGKLFESGGALGLGLAGDLHAQMDGYGKAHGLTVTFAPWHPKPEYVLFKTGDLASGNEGFPSGLVIVNERGEPHPWQKHSSP